MTNERGIGKTYMQVSGILNTFLGKYYKDNVMVHELNTLPSSVSSHARQHLRHHSIFVCYG